MQDTDDYTTVEEQVEYGLDAISPDRTIEVSLRDLLYVHQVLGEFIRFFHQPIHYPDLESALQFLGNVDKGALHLLWKCYNDKLRDVWPEDVVKKFDEGEFDNTQSPYYYKPTGRTNNSS